MSIYTIEHDQDQLPYCHYSDSYWEIPKTIWRDSNVKIVWEEKIKEFPHIFYDQNHLDLNYDLDCFKRPDYHRSHYPENIGRSEDGYYWSRDIFSRDLHYNYDDRCLIVKTTNRQKRFLMKIMTAAGVWVGGDYFLNMHLKTRTNYFM